MKNLIQHSRSLVKTFLAKGVLTTIVILAFAFTVNAQAPASFSYQAVVRDLSNNPVANTTLGVQITILRGSSTGSNVFRETHNPVTNSAGLVSLEVGMGNILNGDLQSIDWNNGPYFIEQAIDPNGGTNYTITSTTQLLSVPYALYARNAGRAESAAVADQANSLSAAGAGGLSVPLGTILPYAGTGSSVPAGWLLCDGASYQPSQYPELFSLIGNTYGSNQGQFRVPDLRGRGPVGYNVNEGEFNALGKTGGAKTHTLSLNEMPNHNHTGRTGADTHTHFLNYPGVERNTTGLSDGIIVTKPGDNENLLTTRNRPPIEIFSNTHGHDISSQGGGAPHNNLQPFLTINFIIKAR